MDEFEETDENLPIWKKRRYLIVLLAFFGFFQVYSLRVNLSVGIVAMTENRTVEYSNGTIGYEKYFDWDSVQTGYILSSFFFGYLLTQFFGGLLGFRYGGNLIFGLGILVTALLTLLTPLAAKLGFGVLIVVRIVEGVFEGVTFPAMYDVWSNWAPKSERSRMAGFAIAGNYFGVVVGMTLSGVFAEHFGWESVFYIFGVVGVIWCAIWLTLVKQSPEKDKRISIIEKRYILANRERSENINLREIPWRKIFTSMPVWAIVVAHFCESWGFFTMFTQLPMYLKDVFNYDLSQSGGLSAIPYLVLCVVVFISSYLADYFQFKNILTTTKVRRYFTCFSFIGQVIFMLLAAFVMHPIFSVVFLTIGVGLGGFSLSGFTVNHLDIAPSYAQILFGITNTFGTIPGMISPILSGFIIADKDISSWRIVFYISAGFYLLGSLIYWMFVSGKLQSWAKPQTTQKSQIEITEL